jgi:CBS domain-containing protein
VKVRELFTPNVLITHPGEDLSVAASRMRSHKIGALAVDDKGKLAGIITERDVLRAVGEGRVPEVTIVGEYMTPDPVTVTPEIDAGQAAALMLSLGARHLPVMEGSELVGMLSARDILSLDAWDSPIGTADR